MSVLRVQETYDENGELHSFNDEPAKIKYTREGNIIAMVWYKHGKLHRNDDKPADLGFYPNGSLSWAEWLVEGKTHRKNNPATISYFKDNNACSVEWLENDHYVERGNNLPNSIYCDYKNRERREYWYSNATSQFAGYHNLNGPSIISYKNNKVVNKQYYVNDEFYENEQAWFNTKEVQEHYRNLKNNSRASVATNIAF